VLCLADQNFKLTMIGCLSNSCTACYASAASCD